MAKVVIDNEKIKQINQFYLELKTYAAVARELNISPATVKKYIIPDFGKEITIKKFDVSLIPLAGTYDVIIDETVCSLTESEMEEIKELWKEMTI